MEHSPQSEALRKADELLADIEEGRVDTLNAARRAMALTRLVDDAEGAMWLLWELQGYPASDDGYTLRADARNHVWLSGRVVSQDEMGPSYLLHTPGGKAWVNAGSISRLQQVIEATAVPLDRLLAAPEQWSPDAQKLLREVAVTRRILEDVRTHIHLWAGNWSHRLRFGNAVESAFGVVRERVDRDIAELVPDATVKLSAAFENTISDNPEDWASAAATCRRLLKAAADALRPPGPDVDGRKMGEDQYVNRLVDWIVTQGQSETLADMVTSELEYLGRRLDATLDAGAKGAHAEVNRFDASRFVTGTYLLLGDVLRLRSD